MWRCLDNPTQIHKDVVICTVPWTDSSIPLMAPAVLKPIIERSGHSCLAVDLNVEVYHYSRSHALKEELIQFFFDGTANSSTAEVLDELFDSIAREILAWSPKFVALSLFSYICQHSAKWIAYHIKKYDPDVKIIVGGAGCVINFTGNSPYTDEMIRLGFFDYHIRGDGENSLYELLIGNDSYIGINSPTWQELSKEEVRSMPMPDYTDYHFDIYDKKAMPLLGSRGCVRKCNFCDIIANWKRFEWRTADDIFNEMVVQYEKYNISTFKFQDSLTNGNQKEFMRLLEMIADYNQKSDDKFRWSGYYIFREVSLNSEREWKLLGLSGAERLAVGIENLNQRIRYEIGKKFSNESIDFHLAQAKKNNIGLLLLNIVGYINETEQDIDFIKQWLRDHVEYRNILVIQWGGTLGIFPNTYLDENKEKLGIKMTGTQPSLWVNESINSTPALRASWVKELNQLSRDLGYTVANNLDNHFLLETLINA